MTIVTPWTTKGLYLKTSTEDVILGFEVANVMKTLYCRLRKSTVHRSDTNIKHMSILFAGKDTSESSTTDDDKFINAKNRGGLWKVSPGVFEIFLIVEKHFRANVTNQKRLMFNLWCQH